MLPGKSHRQIYQSYTVTDFNNYDCLKLSWGIWAILIYLLRGYVAVLMSITNMTDKLAIISFFYPQPEQLYLTLISGLPALFLLLVILLRKPDASQWVRVCWQHFRKLALLSLCLALVFEASQWLFWQQLTLKALSVHIAISGLLLLYLKSSKRLAINLAEFPEVIETKKEKPKRLS